MNNKFVKKFKKNLLLTHVIVSAVSMLFLIFFYFIFKPVAGSFVLNAMLQQSPNFIMRFLIYALQSVNLAMLFIFIVILVLGWIIVELRAVGKIGNVINQMDVVFKKNDDMVILDKEFKDIENNLNALKFENMRNEQLAQTEAQRKNDLIAYLAHDIKTPLASVIGYLSLLDETPDLPVEQKVKYTKISLNKAYRLELLINEFFDITRFNLSTIPLEKEDINLHFMLAQMVDEFYPMLTPNDRSATLKVDENMTIYGDADKLARVFNNILKNAIAYSYENSVIEITALVDGQNILIKFINKGRAIPAYKLETIFEKFYRLDTARSTNTGGAGLGLAIAKGIVVQHGGDILATSDEEATVFTVILPAKSR